MKQEWCDCMSKAKGSNAVDLSYKHPGQWIY